ncbi:helix-turn-helix transcriptional regulator [Kordiimonas lipolytica]|uniref:Helix-turn-helix transcriptional regulator n=1 Tax=Kordiimonas lipolytica TaxID=1662421 RepID=A0ABV8U7T4_9PROT|nr:helix-turn-helix transcriptional regulator [Kordiimonas lipolytica]
MLQAIKAARLKLKMPAQELAERLGVARGTLRNIENGLLNVEIVHYLEAAALLGLNIFFPTGKSSEDLHGDLEEILELLPERARRQKIKIDDNF